MRSRLILIPLLIMITLAGGCIPVPLPRHAIDDTVNLQKMIGRGKAIEPGVATRQQVRTALGEPPATDGRQQEMYYYMYCDGVIWNPFFLLYFSRVTGTYWVRLNYDRDDVLQSVDVDDAGSQGSIFPFEGDRGPRLPHFPIRREVVP